MSTTDSFIMGNDLIVSLDGTALGYSDGCKISTQAETGERTSKEAATGKWKEKFVKSFSESINATGFILENGGDDKPTYDQLKTMMLTGEPVDVSYNVRDGESREGKTAGGYTGKFIITQLEADGQANGEDAKYSVQFENSGPVTKVTGGNGFHSAS